LVVPNWREPEFPGWEKGGYIAGNLSKRKQKQQKEEGENEICPATSWKKCRRRRLRNR